MGLSRWNPSENEFLLVQNEFQKAKKAMIVQSSMYYASCSFIPQWTKEYRQMGVNRKFLENCSESMCTPGTDTAN